jgi:DNA-binding NarL/FixJ family response regulator
MTKSETQKKNILIVDNSLLITERLIGILKEVKTAQKIYAASDYAECIDLLGKKKVNIVLLDIQLSGKNGFELLEHIVKNFQNIRVVILSNSVSENYKSRCKKIGAVDFIDKSKDFDLIPGIISDL